MFSVKPTGHTITPNIQNQVNWLDSCTLYAQFTSFSEPKRGDMIIHQNEKLIISRVKCLPGDFYRLKVLPTLNKPEL